MREPAARTRRAVVLLTGDPRIEGERKDLPSKFLAALHRELAATIGAIGYVDLLIGSDRGDEFGIDSHRGSLRRRCVGLGDRVQTSIEYAKELGYAETLIVAGDVAGIGASVFDAAFAALEVEGAGCVIAPSSDGGFSILGIHTDSTLDWGSIPWFTADAASGLRRAAARSGLTVAEIDPVDDIDSRADAFSAVLRLTGQVRLRSLLLGLLQETQLPDVPFSENEICRTTVNPRLRAPPLPKAA